MKKLMIAALMMLGTSAAFAGDSEPLKAILNTKTYSEANQLLQSNLGQLADASEKAKAYEHVTKLALKTFDEQNAIQNQNIQAQITKTAVQQLDTLAFYDAAYNAVFNGMECLKYDAQPNDKGKVKPKYTATLAPLIANARLTLVNAGNYYAQKNDQDGVLKYWGTFLDTDNEPIFSAGKENEKPYLGQVAYYAAAYANQAKQYDRAEKYADIAMGDESLRSQAETLKYTMAQMNLKSHADSLAFAKKMEATYAQEPSNEVVFGIICNMYSGMSMTAELTAAIDKAIAANPKNFTAWATKGQTLVNEMSKSQQPNWDEPINCFKKALEIRPENTVVLTFLGFSLNAKAANVNGNAEQQKAIYQESMNYLEKAKELDPNRTMSNWAYPLYQCYYTLKPDAPETKELESMLKK